MDFKVKLVCLTAPLTRVISKVVAINVAGAIIHGTSSIRSKIVLIMTISPECAVSSLF